MRKTSSIVTKGQEISSVYVLSHYKTARVTGGQRKVRGDDLISAINIEVL